MPTSLRGALLRILHDYSHAKQEAFTNHPLAHFIRSDLAQALESHIDDNARYLCKASPGQGNWTATPWAAIFDVLVTDTAQRGYYPVFLFREDLSGVYLSLNQGVTELRSRYKAAASEILLARASDFRAQLGGVNRRHFPLDTIDLRTSGATALGNGYEDGNICALFFSASAIPTDNELAVHIRRVLNAYRILSSNETIPINLSSVEEDELSLHVIEDLTKLREHKRIERSRLIAETVKKVQGTTCAVCGMDFESNYGEIGRGYIEVHHLTPVSELQGQRLHRDPKRDFAVLCSNCHRMIHRSAAPHDIEGFTKRHLKLSVKDRKID